MLVTKRSSPTSWQVLPIRSVTCFQPSQSSSDMPSSIEKIGIGLGELGQVGGLLAIGALLAFAFIVVDTVLEELGGGAIERQDRCPCPGL